MSNALTSSRMVKKTLTSLLAAAALAVSVAAHGALLPRDINGDGIVDAYYDTAQNITWLADWNASGQLLTWDQAVAWAASLNINGVTGWRLPGITDTGNPGCDFSVAGGTDCGYNVDTRTSDLGRLWYVTLGNLAFCARGEPNCDLQGPGQPGWGLTNTGPFRNMQGASYWTGTEYAADTSEAWSFATDDGGQDSDAKTNSFHAVAVHAGDVAPAPVGYKVIDLGVGTANGAGGGEQVGGAGHALLWTGSADSVVDLHPQGFTFSIAQGTAGRRQVGYADDKGGARHAMLWRGSAATAVDLTPRNFRDASAYGADIEQQAGYGELRDQSLPHALLWTGSAASAIDLHPSGFSSSQAWAVGDGQQVGVGVPTVPTIPGNYHALLWAGRAASVVDLHPAGFTDSAALGVAGGQQVGWARDGPVGNHAMLWTGSASSVVDLNPPGSSSVANAVAGGQQVGHVSGSSLSLMAMVWAGSAQSAVNLHDFLPGHYDVSDAVGIDDAGNIVGGAGHIVYLFGHPTISSHAVLWVPALPYGLDIGMTGSPDLVHIGDQITYAITVTNSRSGTATGVRVSDALPGGITLLSATTDRGSCSGTTCDLDTLPGGSSAHVTLAAQLSQGFSSTSVNNSASVSADDLITKSAVVATPVAAFADLSITETVPATAVGTNNLTYEITVNNRGAFPATGVTVRDTLPGGVNLVSANSTRGSCAGSATITCSIGTLSVGTNRILNAGAWATVTIVVTPTQEGTISNTATVAANEPDPNPANNSATQNTAVVAAPLPDLTGSWQSPAQACETRRGVTTCSITGKVNVVNQGTATAGACIARLYLSNDNSFSADDVLLGQVNIPRLQAGATKAIKVKPSLPAGSNASGKFLIAVLDATGIVTETDKSNNNVPSGRIP